MASVCSLRIVVASFMVVGFSLRGMFLFYPCLGFLALWLEMQGRVGMPFQYWE